jgi:shikimate dehydrogenase
VLATTTSTAVGPATALLGPRTRLAGIIGDPVRHSLSPAMHNAAFHALGLDWAYLAFEVPEGQGRALGLVGLSVTMPHKAAVLTAVDRLSPVAAALGAVNTVVRRAGDVLEGDNTDGAGFLDAIRQDEGFDPAGRRCLVVGAGGAARAVVKALADAGAAAVVVANRTPTRAAAAAALAGPVGRVGELGDTDEADLVVNATSVGMGDGNFPFDPGLLARGQLVADIVYHPSPTPLLVAASAAGATTVGGLGMLVHQAGHAFRHWTGREPPLVAMRDAAMSELGG